MLLSLILLGTIIFLGKVLGKEAAIKQESIKKNIKEMVVEDKSKKLSDIVVQNTPTKELEYLSNKALELSIAVIAIFVVTCVEIVVVTRKPER